MAFIDWLKKQHADSLRASQRMAADPFLRGMQPGANTAPAPQGAIPFQRTKPGFFARDYKKEDLVDNTLTIKNDGTETLVKKWKDPDQSALRVSALGDVAGSPLTLGPPQRFDRAPIAGQSYPGGSYGKSLRGVHIGAQAPRRVQPRVSDPMNTRPGTVGGSLHHPASIANIGMPQVADLRNRIAAIDRQQAAIPRQQMPPPRFVPPVDPSQFPSVQDRNTGTYTLPPPQVELNRGGFSPKNIGDNYTNWWDQNVRRQAVGDTSTIGGKIPQAFWDFYEENPTIHQAVGAGVKSGIWDPIKERMDKILEDIRKRREGQTMAPFDWRNN